MSLNQRVTAEFSTCTPSAPPTADLSIQTTRQRQVSIPPAEPGLSSVSRSKRLMRGR
jgi:hypothetical protein